ncbi:MAG: S24 family peptidase [Lachnospiraceae bacterium]|nr:S24 family peptidase [Lachnospiraceae bacterium]
MSFGTRLKEKREVLGITQPQLAEMLGVSKGAIGNWETDVNSPRATLLYDLFDILHCDANYLFQDETRELYKDEASPEEFENIIKKYRFVSEHHPEGAKAVEYILNHEYVIAEKMKKEKERITELESQPTAVIDFPVRSNQAARIAEYFRSASAGGGVFILGNEATSKITVSESDWDDRVDYVIRVSGHSMEPDYNDGDMVMVSQRLEMQHGDVGIFVINGKAYIKEYGEKELISRNPESDNIKISEYDNIVCMGKVIGKLKGQYEIIDD